MKLGHFEVYLRYPTPSFYEQPMTTMLGFLHVRVRQHRPSDRICSTQSSEVGQEICEQRFDYGSGLICWWLGIKSLSSAMLTFSLMPYTLRNPSSFGGLGVKSPPMSRAQVPPKTWGKLLVDAKVLGGAPLVIVV